MRRANGRMARALLVTLTSFAAARAALLPLQAEQLRAAVGGFAVMNCHLDFPFGNEIPYHLQWDKDGEVIFSWHSGEAGPGRAADRWGGRVWRAGGDGATGLGGGAINVTSVRDSDTGLYRCRVTFPNRTPPARNNGTFYYLQVEGGDLIATPPMNVTTVEGERAELECLPRDVAAEVTWYKDGEPLSALPTLAARAQRPAGGSLVLEHAEPTDAGQYACRVRLPPAADQMATAYLDVHFKAKIVYAAAEQFFPLGRPASLDCHFSANPPLTNLRWEKDGFLFDPYNVPGVFYSRNGSLLFNKVDESHEGLYSCTAYNALGSAGPSPAMRVRVLRAPALLVAPPPLLVARLGASARLPCVPHAHSPAPSLIWHRKDGLPLPADRVVLDGGNLTITQVEAADRGEYVCTVSNDAASVSAIAELMIENMPPRAPYNLTARADGDSLHLSWLPGQPGVEVDYVVWHRAAGAGEWRSMKLLSRGSTRATLLRLRRGELYELRVLAVDPLGDSLFSKPLYVRMVGDGETVAPEEMDAELALSAAGAAARAGAGPGARGGGPEGGDSLQVSVRLLDEGALVRWEGAPPGARCELRWYLGDQLVHSAHTHNDYALVGEIAEGAQYTGRVSCGAGGAGFATLQVPAWSRLRVAAAAAAGALLLAAALAALIAARRSQCAPRLKRRR